MKKNNDPRGPVVPELAREIVAAASRLRRVAETTRSE
jgi:hypothetical protein